MVCARRGDRQETPRLQCAKQYCITRRVCNTFTQSCSSATRASPLASKLPPLRSPRSKPPAVSSSSATTPPAAAGIGPSCTSCSVSSGKAMCWSSGHSIACHASLRDVLTIMERVQERHAGFRSLKEAVDTTTPAGSDDDADGRRVRRVRARDAQGTDQGGPRRRAQGRPDRRPAAEAQAPPATGNCDARQAGEEDRRRRGAPCSASTRQRCRGYSGGPRSSLLPYFRFHCSPSPNVRRRRYSPMRC